MVFNDFLLIFLIYIRLLEFYAANRLLFCSLKPLRCVSAPVRRSFRQIVGGDETDFAFQCLNEVVYGCSLVVSGNSIAGNNRFDLQFRLVAVIAEAIAGSALDDYLVSDIELNVDFYFHGFSPRVNIIRLLNGKANGF